MTVELRFADKLKHLNRTARLAVYRTSTPLFDDKFAVERDRGDANGLVIVDHAIEFKIELDLKKQPNPCTIKVRNLNESSRSALKRQPLRVELEAGHDGVTRLLYRGDAYDGDSEMDGPTWVTTLECGDGDRIYSAARMNRSYAPGTRIKDVIRDVCTSIGQRVPDNILKSTALDDQLPLGWYSSGRLVDELENFLEPLGYSMSFQNNQIQIIGDEETAGGEWEISEETGMLGSPRSGQPTRKQPTPPVIVDHLLYPDLTPGGVVRLKSREHNGRYKVIKVAHRGETHGLPWQTEVELRPIKTGGGNAKPGSKLAQDLAKAAISGAASGGSGSSR